MTESTDVATISAYWDLAALAVVVLGIVVARFVSLGVAAALRLVDQRLARAATSAQSALTPRLILLTKTIVFWVILALAVALALQLLSVSGVSNLINALLNFIPQALVACAIVLVGHLLGLLASGLLTQLYDDISSDSLGPRLLHGTFVAVAVVMGLDQVDLDISFLTQTVLILVAAICGGLMLAFALGARQHVANLLAHRELKRFSVGDHIEVGSVVGTIIEIHETNVDVATDKGIMSVPAETFASTCVLRKSEERFDD